MRPERRPRPAWIQAIVAVSSLLLLTAFYLLLMRLSLDVSRVGSAADADRRDLVYLLLHASLLLFAGALGFALGRWLSGLGIAYAVLFVAVLAVAMAFAQIGSQRLACEGHNDLIRHWECS